MHHATKDGSRGQILILFTFALVAMLAMLGLLFDGGKALSLRRQLQNAGDAGALAAVNIIQSLTPRGCSATAGPPPGAPQAAVVTAARAAVKNSMPWITDAQITVTCPDGWNNSEVQVDVTSTSQTLFGRVVGISGLTATTTSGAVNGQITGLNYSIVQLNPSDPTWPTGRKGCPSFLISGGPQLTLEGSIVVDSNCSAANGGAFSANGNSAAVTLNNNAKIRLVGDFVPGPLVINPAPVIGTTPVRDPLAGLPAMLTTLPTRSNSKLIIGSGSSVLDPGVYVGGIQMKAQAKAFLRPGIYVMKGGGFDIGAGNEVYSVPAGVSTTTAATWATDCPKTTCGILLYNTSGSGSNTMGQFTVGAGAILKLRPYVPSADTTGANVTDYKNLLFWQDASPVPTNSYAQPVVALSGGGAVDLTGTIYAPSAQVTMGGGAGGSGGATDVTVQFITWDMTLSGNSSFIFRFASNEFAKPLDYGLIR